MVMFDVPGGMSPIKTNNGGAHILSKRAASIAERIQGSDAVHVVTHIDADGITAGAIAVHTLQQMEKDYSIDFIKQLDSKVVQRLIGEDHELVWFTDLGSSIVESQTSLPMVVTDHHSCGDGSDLPIHLNPHLFGLDGGFQLSGAGATYLVATSVDTQNQSLAGLAIVGACGDLQDRKHRRLTGVNEQIVIEGEQAGVLARQLDISYFGRETRPIHKMLQYANDPIIPGITGREQAALRFLDECNIIIKDGEDWRRWFHLSKRERTIILSALANRLLSKGFGHQTTMRLLSETYLLIKEEEGSELHDSKEFATLLNSTARYGQYDVGLAVCLGDRGAALKKARSLLRGHRKNLVEGLQYAKEEGITQGHYVQYFHANMGIRDTIIGIVTNMLLNDDDIRADLPLIGFADKNKNEVKASARASQMLVDKGLDLSKALTHAAHQVDGSGGGHNIAAGATIPKGKELEFLKIVEQEVKKQLAQ